MLQRRLGSALGLAALIALAPSAGLAAPCPAFKVSAPAQGALLQAMPANPAGCTVGVPLRLRSGETVWRCPIEAPDGVELAADAPTHARVVTRGDAVLFHANDSAAGVALDDIRVVEVDLSGDGAPERVLAARLSESQGLGISRWRLDVFDAQWTHLGQEGEVADWGATAFAAHPTREGCAAVVTTYLSYDMPGGREALFLAAELADVRNGAFDRMFEGPRWERRLDRRLTALRDQAMSTGSNPERDAALWVGALRR